MSAIALPITVADIVDEYASKAASVDMAIADLKEAHKRINLAATVQGTFVEPIAQEPYVYPDAVRKNLLKSGWRAVYQRLQIDTIASANDKRLFDRALADPPPLTVENAKATFGDYLIRPRFHILRGVAEVFTALDTAYKSHSKVRIGVKGLPKRVILNGWNGFGSYARDRFQDMVRAMAALRNQPPLEWCEMLDIDEQHKTGSDAFMNGRLLKRFVAGGEDEEWTAPDRGITIRKFANGNAHVFFDKWALLDINRALGEFYGEVLPDAEPEGVKPSASTAVSKDLQFYWTPPAVVEEALGFAGLPDRAKAYNRSGISTLRVLEPSCGDGRILDGIRSWGHSAFGIEYHPGRAAEARMKGHSVLTANFLEQPATPEFDAVVMNPPFYGRHYIKHVRHALRFLKPGGTLVSILPATARYDHGELQGEWRDLPVASFADAGTNVPTTMIRIVNR